MKDREVASQITILGWTFIILLVLKLNPGGYLATPIAEMSWWWVTAPLWLPYAILFVVAAVCIGISLILNRNKR